METVTNQLGTCLVTDNFLTSVQHHPIATLCASYCSEVSKYLAVTRPGTFPDVRELLLSRCCARAVAASLTRNAPSHQPDMLVVGNTPCPGARGNHCHSLTHDQEQTQMAIWAISASPLIMGNDMRNVSATSKAILLNKDAIAVQMLFW